METERDRQITRERKRRERDRHRDTETQTNRERDRERDRERETNKWCSVGSMQSGAGRYDQDIKGGGDESQRSPKGASLLPENVSVKPRGSTAANT